MLGDVEQGVLFNRLPNIFMEGCSKTFFELRDGVHQGSDKKQTVAKGRDGVRQGMCVVCIYIRNT